MEPLSNPGSTSSPSLHKSPPFRLLLPLAAACVIVIVRLSDYLPASPVQALGFAKSLISRGQPRQAESLLSPFLTDTDPLPDLILVYSQILFSEGELLKAENVLHRFRHRLDWNDVDVLRTLGFVLYYRGNLDSAARVAERLISTGERTNLPDIDHSGHYLLGRVEFNRGGFEKARFHQMKALSLAREAGSKKLEADALRQLGVLCWYDGKRDSALKWYYEPALAKYRETGDRSGEATTLSNIGLLHHEWGNWVENLICQTTTLSIRQAIGDKIGLADSYYFVTLTPLWSSRAISFCHEYRMKSYALSKEIGYAWGEEVARRSLEEELFVGVEWKDEESEGFADWNRSAEGIFQSHMSRGTLSFSRGRDSLSLYHLRTARRLADSLNYPDGRRRAFTAMSQVLLRMGRYREARAMIDSARTLLSGGRRTKEQRDLELYQADLLAKTGHTVRAVTILRAIITELDSSYASLLASVNPTVALETAAGALYKTRSKSFDLLIPILVRQSAPSAVRASEEERSLPFWLASGREDALARNTIRRIVRAQEQSDSGQDDRENFDRLETLLTGIQHQLVIERAIQSAQGSYDAHIPGVDEVRECLEPRERVISYYLTESDGFAFVFGSDFFEVVHLSHGEKTLGSLVDVFNATIARGRDNPMDDAWKGPASRLWDICIKPVFDTGHLRGGRRLIIVPHKSLNKAPFAVFSSGDTVLAQNFAVSQHLSLSSLVEQRRHDVQSLSSIELFAPNTRLLVHSDREVELISSCFPGRSTVSKDLRSTERAVVAALGSASIVHLATHVRINEGHPLYSAIMLSGGELELHELLRTTIRARLVVLSGCETGRGIGVGGEILSPENLVSFPRAFLTAGASAVLASHWIVGDAETSEFMAAFYTKLAHNPDLLFDDALCAVQVDSLRKTDKSGRVRHPFFWASFALTGDCR